LLIENRSIRRLFIKTGAVCALTAALVGTRLDLAWAGSFSLGAMMGILNFYALAVLLIAVTKKNMIPIFPALTVKLIVLVSMLVFFLPNLMTEIPAFLVGFSAFLLVSTLEAMGWVISASIRPTEESKRLIDEWRRNFLGSSADA